MAIENRDLAAGTKLVARYRGAEHSVLVVGDTETGLGFELDNGTIYKSLSSAGKAVMNGVACNGWRFWSRAGEAVTETAEEVAPAHGAKAKPTTKTVRQIRKLPNQKGVPEGQVKWFCSACQRSFLIDGKDAPAACPEGHPLEQEDEFATTD
jgi:hypothetical protein